MGQSFKHVSYSIAMKGLVVLIFIVVFGIPQCIFAQENATLSGTITDTTGAVLQHASIKAHNTSTGLVQTVLSNGAGIYFFAALPPGPYSITITANGFSTRIINTTLTVAEQATINSKLFAKSVTQRVIITSTPLLLNTETASISNVVNSVTIKELPLNGRDPSSLVFLSPGVNNVLKTNAGYNLTAVSFANEMGASSGGSQQGGTYALLDGIPNMDFYMGLAAPFPNADATEEFRAITNNFGAQYGFAPGAVISIETKSGTNRFHGGLFEFVRNQMFNATNWFTGAVDTLKRNQFGGDIGGPIKRNKLFFFFNYQGTRTSQASASNFEMVPTVAELNGDFSALPETLNAPFATINGKRNQINPSLFLPASVKIAEDALPVATNPEEAITGMYIAGPKMTESMNEETARLDYNVSQRQRLFIRSFIQRYNQPNATVPGDILVNSVGNRGSYFNEALGYTWIPTSNLVNVLSAAWTNMYVVSAGQVFDKNGNPFCLSKYYNVADPPGCYVEGFGTDDYWSTGYNEPNSDYRSTWWLSNNATMTFGKHVLVAGIDLAKQFSDYKTQFPAAPLINFGPTFTGDDEADFLLGYANFFEQGAYENAPVKGWQMALYAQDRYRLTPNLIINMGVRWEPDMAARSINSGAAYIAGKRSQIYPQAPVGLVFPGEDGVTDTLRPSDYKYVVPRIGIAWQPLGPRTVFRAAFGLFEAPFADSFYNHVVGVPPFAPTYEFNSPGPPSAPYSAQDPWSTLGVNGGISPFPAQFEQNTKVPASQAFFSLPVGLTKGSLFARTFHVPMTQSWNASVEQQIGNDLALHIAYVGSETYHQTLSVDLNAGVYAPGVGGVRPNPDFTSIQPYTSAGTASYNALQASFQMRESHGLQFQTSFTWSKNLDTASWGNGAFYGGLPNPFNIGFNYGISDLNLPLVSVTNFVYTSPKLVDQNPIIREIGGSWELTGIWTIESGSPFTIMGGDGNDNSGSLQNEDRADSVQGESLNMHQGDKSHWLAHYFNTAAFTSNPLGTFGDIGKNTLKGPGLNYADIGIDKNWWIYNNRYRFQLRCSLFNAFNHPSFGDPGATVGTPSFGVINNIGSEPPRVMQLGAKLAF